MTQPEEACPMILGRQLVFASGGTPRVWIEPAVFPRPEGCQVLVQNSHTHVSAGTELNFLRHGPGAYGAETQADPATLGYMSVGRVVAVGRDVRDLSVWEIVAGSGRHASHALFDLAAGANLERVPDGVPAAQAGFAVLGDVALHAVRRARLQIDQSVAVFGVGMVGQLALQLASIAGAHPVIAIDLQAGRLEAARESGAAHVVDASREDVPARVRDLTGNGAEAVFVCAGSSAVLQPALECAAARATVVLVGSSPAAATIDLQRQLLRKELTLLGSYESGLAQAHPYWPWTRARNRRACLRLMAAGRLKLGHLVSRVIPPEEAPGMYQTMLQGSPAVGVVIQWS
jgi:threonine dehydrogenase-like Zn-dependent dehydrogenase